MRLRSKRGVHSLELVAGLLVFVPVMLYGFDYATILYAGTVNSNTCTAAARAAASGPSNSLATGGNTPQARAAAVIARMTNPKGMIRVGTLVRISETFTGTTPTSPFGGPLLGTVTVKTRCDVFPPFLLPLVPADIILYTTQQYPWTWIMPANYSGGAGGAPTKFNDLSSPL